MSKENQKLFKEKGYAIIPNALTDELRDFVTQYALFDEMQNFSANDEQIPDAHSKYADPVMETMLLHLHNLMEENTGLKLFPTYSYYRIYRKGNELTKHTDRDSCEISTTVCFNYSYDDSKYTWPIYVDNYPVTLKPGDLVIYRGIDLEHWRDPFNCPNENDWHVQGFFHFVDANGPCQDWKFDKRDTIGSNPKKKQQNQIIKLDKPYITYT